MVLKKIKYTVDYFKYLDNPIEALKFKFGFSNQVNLKVEENSILIDDINELNSILAMLPHIPTGVRGEYIKEENQYCVF